ncbi:nuclear transport factor 2 family protein [Parasphingorhabdus sp.]|uniref:nuclear transport factor 2 family protein n=1 Tax=Parasphingorhabdus sp. TaxID=2709688 RepID=UPI0035934BDF
MKTVTAADKIKVVDTYIASYNKGDLEGIVSIFADDATAEDPVGTPLLRGKEAIRTFMQAGVSMGAQLRLEGSIRCAGDYAAFPFVVELELDGKLTGIEVIDIFKFDEHGKVIEMRAFFGPDNMKAA